MAMQEIVPKVIKTDRLSVSYIEKGNKNNPVLILVHGNVSSSVFWTQTINSLSDQYYVIAPDLRGYGETEALPIDATLGLSQWSEDLKAFIEGLNLTKPINLMGWSLGGGIIMDYSIKFSEDIDSLILLNPISPYGFGGTKDICGTPCNLNYSGTGGGGANPDFITGLKSKDNSSTSPNSPINVLNQLYFKPPFTVSKEFEEVYLASMFSTKVAEGLYPGDFVQCEEWPGIAPGAMGINNSFSPKYMNLEKFAGIPKKIPVLWIRGENDLIVSDQSFLDFGYLGQAGYVPGWPGKDVYPPQPMVSQTRYVLDKYQRNGGEYKEVVIKDSGHAPHIEKEHEFNKIVLDFLHLQ